jgi:hypothetical protein
MQHKLFKENASSDSFIQAYISARKNYPTYFIFTQNASHFCAVPGERERKKWKKFMVVPFLSTFLSVVKEKHIEKKE